MIVCGLYVVLWGKAQELKKKKSELVSLENTTRGEFENVEVVSSAPRSQQPWMLLFTSETTYRKYEEQLILFFSVGRNAHSV